MQRLIRWVAFTTIAITTGLALQCGPPTIEGVLDAALPDVALPDAATDAFADVDIPEGCLCAESLNQLDARLMEVEQRLAAVEEPAPGTFSLLLAAGGGPAGPLDVEDSYIGASATSQATTVSMGAGRAVDGSSLLLSFTVPKSVALETTVPLAELRVTASLYSYTDPGAECPTGTSCSVIVSPCGHSIGEATGSVRLTAHGERISGRVSGTFRGADGCEFAISEGHFDANIRHPDAGSGEYVAP